MGDVVEWRKRKEIALSGITKGGEWRSDANCDSRRRRRHLIDRSSVYGAEVETGRSLKRRRVVSPGSVNKKRIYLLRAASITLMAAIIMPTIAERS